jgi:hypothetical protein
MIVLLLGAAWICLIVLSCCLGVSARRGDLEQKVGESLQTMGESLQTARSQSLAVTRKADGAEHDEIAAAAAQSGVARGSQRPVAA